MIVVHIDNSATHLLLCLFLDCVRFRQCYTCMASSKTPIFLHYDAICKLKPCKRYHDDSAYADHLYLESVGCVFMYR